MAMRVDTLDEDLITCQICLYEFDEEIKKPKFLQCSHTICLECFQVRNFFNLLNFFVYDIQFG
jgi:hypothetical protein